RHRARGRRGPERLRPRLSTEENLLGYIADLVESERSLTADADRFAIGQGHIEVVEMAPSRQPYGLPSVAKAYPTVAVTTANVTYGWGSVWTDVARFAEAPR